MPVTSSEGKRVLDTGIALPLTNQSVTVAVAGFGNFEFRFHHGTGAQSIEITSVGGGATVHLHNINDSPLGGGLTEPHRLGQMNGRDVYLNLRWNGLNGIGPYLIYAFYQDA